MYSSMTAIIKTQSKVLVHQLALRLRYRRQLEAAVEEKRVDIVTIVHQHHRNDHEHDNHNLNQNQASLSIMHQAVSLPRTLPPPAPSLGHRCDDVIGNLILIMPWWFDYDLDFDKGMILIMPWQWLKSGVCEVFGVLRGVPGSTLRIIILWGRGAGAWNRCWWKLSYEMLVTTVLYSDDVSWGGMGWGPQQKLAKVELLWFRHHH